jgi:hypothetical protein
VVIDGSHRILAICVGYINNFTAKTVIRVHVYVDVPEEFLAYYSMVVNNGALAGASTTRDECLVIMGNLYGDSIFNTIEVNHLFFNVFCHPQHFDVQVCGQR